MAAGSRGVDDLRKRTLRSPSQNAPPRKRSGSRRAKRSASAINLRASPSSNSRGNRSTWSAARPAHGPARLPSSRSAPPRASTPPRLARAPTRTGWPRRSRACRLQRALVRHLRRHVLACSTTPLWVPAHSGSPQLNRWKRFTGVCASAAPMTAGPALQNLRNPPVRCESQSASGGTQGPCCLRFEARCIALRSSLSHGNPA